MCYEIWIPIRDVHTFYFYSWRYTNRLKLRTSSILSSSSFCKTITIIFMGLRADFLSPQKLLAPILLQKKSIMQVLAAKVLMSISIVNTVCECFLPWHESQPKLPVANATHHYFSDILENTCHSDSWQSKAVTNIVTNIVTNVIRLVAYELFFSVTKTANKNYKNNNCQLLHQYSKVLAACNIQGERESEFSFNIAQSQYFVSLL